MTTTLPTLETSRLRLRPAAPADAAVIADLCCATEVRLFPWDDECPSEAQVAELLQVVRRAGAPHGFWLLEPLDGGAAIGVAGLVPPGTAAEADVRLLRTGHGTEALAAVLTFAFDGAGWQSVAAAVAVRDDDALRLALRLGFTPMGEVDGPVDRLRTFRLERDAFVLADVQPS